MDNNECKLYTLYHGEKPVAYRYGEPWVAQQPLMEGVYDTPEEAKEAWNKEAADDIIKALECDFG